MMIFLGRSSVVISSDTRAPLRRKYIEQFKAGEIEFIFNYGVLTTGFDAPKTENIVICRPTFSDVLYEQIVGRGLRGPKFGGTATCTIIDFCDNYFRFGDQQAYKRFENSWYQPIN
jgi:superfamily II DNA or RNA helicase